MQICVSSLNNLKQHIHHVPAGTNIESKSVRSLIDHNSGTARLPTESLAKQSSSNFDIQTIHFLRANALTFNINVIIRLSRYVPSQSFTLATKDQGRQIMLDHSKADVDKDLMGVEIRQITAAAHLFKFLPLP